MCELLMLNKVPTENKYINTKRVFGWKSTGLSLEGINSPVFSLAPKVSYYNKIKIYLKVNSSILEQKKAFFAYENVINDAYIVCCLNILENYSANNFTI